MTTITTYDPLDANSFLIDITDAVVASQSPHIGHIQMDPVGTERTGMTKFTIRNSRSNVYGNLVSLGLFQFKQDPATTGQDRPLVEKQWEDHYHDMIRSSMKSNSTTSDGRYIQLSPTQHRKFEFPFNSSGTWQFNLKIHDPSSQTHRMMHFTLKTNIVDAYTGLKWNNIPVVVGKMSENRILPLHKAEEPLYIANNVNTMNNHLIIGDYPTLDRWECIQTPDNNLWSEWANYLGTFDPNEFGSVYIASFPARGTWKWGMGLGPSMYGQLASWNATITVEVV